MSNRKWQEWLGAEGLRPWNKSWVEVEDSDGESEGSGLSGWKARGMQDIAFGLLGIKELLREQNGLLRRIAQGIDGGLGASNEEDSTVRE